MFVNVRVMHTTNVEAVDSSVIVESTQLAVVKLGCLR